MQPSSIQVSNLFNLLLTRCIGARLSALWQVTIWFECWVRDGWVLTFEPAFGEFSWLQRHLDIFRLNLICPPVSHCLHDGYQHVSNIVKAVKIFCPLFIFSVSFSMSSVTTWESCGQLFQATLRSSARKSCMSTWRVHRSISLIGGLTHSHTQSPLLASLHYI